MNCAESQSASQVTGQIVSLQGQEFYRIENYDQIPDFFISLISPWDHWLFISSTGGIAAGRKNADNAIFPYETDDKLAQNYANTGSRSIVRIGSTVWEPFMPHTGRLFAIQRNLYKNRLGNILIFEEHNFDLGLRLRIEWGFSDRYGLVRKTELKSQKDQHIQILDGIQNILPAGCSVQLTQSMSNLLDAYKKNEQYPDLLALYTLSAILSDRAEPSESLQATSVWASLTNAKALLLSSRQLPAYLSGLPLSNEVDERARRGSYLLEQDLHLQAGQLLSWYIVVELRQNHAAITQLQAELRNKHRLCEDLKAELKLTCSELYRVIGNCDGIQHTADKLASIHHGSNVIFNTMRGGYFAYAYQLPVDDLLQFARQHNKRAAQALESFVAQNFPQARSIALEELESRLWAENAVENTTDYPGRSTDLQRLYYEYIPITFSRRHGDPSRPWNVFSIDIKASDGSKKLAYQGNWRDIFQNWEALTLSFPKYIHHIIVKFLNASTADGYNPYRITQKGIDWERPEPDSPWSNIGYWGDHQLIYLLKLLEFASQTDFPRFMQLSQQEIFCYSNVPYRIRPFEQLLQNPKDSIVFDFELEAQILQQQEQLGSDARLLHDGNDLYYVSFTEKLLVTVLSKLSNLIPGSGIWLNTQRPEWNDANNALVGYGVSAVTLFYLRRFLAFMLQVYRRFSTDKYTVSQRLLDLFEAIYATLSLDDAQQIFVQLSQAGSQYRSRLYAEGPDSQTASLAKERLLDFCQSALDFLDPMILANQRKDKLFHSYNLLDFDTEGRVRTEYLYEMLEGQVAALSCGLLSAPQVLEVLQAMRQSSLYREDQNSYMLYPYPHFPNFMEKNCFSAQELTELAKKYAKGCDGETFFEPVCTEQPTAIIQRDCNGEYHFNSSYHNLNDLLADLQAHSIKDKLGQACTELFERCFRHREFTGRSGTFFAYEGLGSIYWHMVSKLLLAVAENIFWATGKAEEGLQQKLIAHYYEIRKGLGFHKTPTEQEAFPIDPYSHTPWGMGAKQPGMTGQVKEEILTRYLELGLLFEDDQLAIRPQMLRPSEFFPEPCTVDYLDVKGQYRQVDLKTNSLFFTYCQTAFVYRLSEDRPGIFVHYQSGKIQEFTEMLLPREITQSLIRRNTDIQQVEVLLSPNMLYWG